MDIDLLSKMVKELILDNDRVALPGLGTFVAELVPSTFSDRGYTINPPYRRLYFRERPDQGDELSSFYARSNNIDEDVAAKIVTDFVSELKSVLHTRKLVVFPGLGRLRATKENNIFFVADENLDIYPAGFGLEPVSLKTHSDPVIEVVADTLPEAVLPAPSEPASGETEEDAGDLSVSAQEELIEVQPVIEVEVAEENMDEENVAEEPQLEESGRSVWKMILRCIVVAILIGVVLLMLLAVIGRVWPEVADRLLYTREELKILYYL